MYIYILILILILILIQMAREKNQYMCGCLSEHCFCRIKSLNWVWQVTSSAWAKHWVLKGSFPNTILLGTVISGVTIMGYVDLQGIMQRQGAFRTCASSEAPTSVAPQCKYAQSRGPGHSTWVPLGRHGSNQESCILARIPQLA